MARRTDFEREQQESFEEFKTAEGEGFAYFYNCVKYNMPFRYEAIPQNRESNQWYGYLDGLVALEVDVETETFFDGETNPSGLLKAKEEDEETKHERQLRDWGNFHDQGEYDRLDEIHGTYMSRLKGTGGCDEQQEDTLRVCSELRLKMEKMLKNDDKDSIDMANKLSKMIQDNLAAENLRKKDMKPTQVQRLDGIVEELEKRFGVGAGLTHSQACAAFHKWQKGQHFAMTLDAADQVILAIINTMARNNDQPEFAELPEDCHIVDQLGSFEGVRSQAEQEAYDYIGASPMIRKKKESGDS